MQVQNQVYSLGDFTSKEGRRRNEYSRKRKKGHDQTIAGPHKRGIENPNGLKVDFKIAGDCKFMTQGLWYGDTV